MVHFSVASVEIAKLITKEQSLASNSDFLYVDAVRPVSLNTHQLMFQYIKHGKIHFNFWKQ
jgi:hypothetical protein